MQLLKSFILSAIVAIVVPFCLAFAYFSCEIDRNVFVTVPSEYINITINDQAAFKNESIGNSVKDVSLYRVSVKQSFLNAYKIKFILAFGICLVVYMMLWILAIHMKYLPVKKTKG